MKLIVCLLAAFALTIAVSGEQQRILRRVIKSTPTATNLARVRAVTVRSPAAEKGAVAEISSKEAANFGQRSANETAASSHQSSGLKSKFSSVTTTSSPSTTTTPSTTTPSSTTTTSTTSKPEQKQHKASDRQQTAPQSPSGEVELLAGAPSSWQTMTAVEAPAAMLIATGTRAASNDLSSAGSTLISSSSEESSSTGDFLRSSSSKTNTQQLVGETFSRIRQQSSKTSQPQQQTYFYPQQQQAVKSTGKTSYQQTKTHWYQPSTTTPRPAPIIQEQQYEQQNEQYVEQQQQQQVEYGAAPLGQAEPFAFDFNTQDNRGNGQYRKEESDKNGVVRGSYGYTDANGIYRHVEYVADQNGFRANIKSNEPGLIGETQPASIQLQNGGSGAAQSASSRLSTSSNNDNNGEWVASSASSNDQGSSAADLALAPPDFESSHKSDRIRAPRHFRN